LINDIQLTETELLTVKSILLKSLPADTKVWVFGSRAKNAAKPFSDLDLALENISGAKIDEEIIYRLQNDFEYPSLPWTVDVLDLNSVSEGFKKIIERDKKKLI
jgi:predicted nucleotidyltransferase